ncbi:unnamed protein product [Trifolium pratense]|uniref:Uncharacterized protein n=1 Tax=Trifolium pratense TaxID=57577 RepID=A0ACB0INY9_TRIPR|nr:unnamed protein product [Trifolium pratense]
MIAGYQLNVCFYEAMELFEVLLKEGNVTLLSALSAVPGLAVLSNGRLIHLFIVTNGFELDGVLGTSLTKMYSKCGSIESAVSVFKSIANNKLWHWTAINCGLMIEWFG